MNYFSILRVVYSSLFTLLLPFLFLKLLFCTKRKNTLLRYTERLGLVDVPPHTLWVHAVSVGEVLAARPLILKLYQRYQRPILITTTTRTGSDRVQDLFKKELDNKIFFHCYMPYDIAFIMRRFMKKVEPCYLLIMETELWPNVLLCAHEQKVPVMIVNARLSPHSFKNYCKIKKIMQYVLDHINVIATQSESDLQRYRFLGSDHNMVNTGNIKYDLEIPINTREKAVKLTESWGRDRRVFIAASTHEGEEKIILSAFLALKQNYPDLLLLIVPRHPERFEAVFQLCVQTGLSVGRRSTKAIHKAIDIFLGDSMGDLWEYYAASQIAFVGGSLVPVGGHNFLEPAALGLALLSGPHLFNFEDISNQLKKMGALSIVQDAVSLESQIRLFLGNPDLVNQVGLAGQRVVDQNKGAIDRVIDLIKPEYMPQYVE